MTKKLYIGNLSPQANEEVLTALFSMFGKVEKAYLVLDKQTGESKGYGFVIMSTEAEAQKAIKALDGKKVGDYTVKVEETNGK
jgi:RNA recognition motif-containing protein